MTKGPMLGVGGERLLVLPPAANRKRYNDGPRYVEERSGELGSRFAREISVR
jgi:hypothetical protein